MNFTKDENDLIYYFHNIQENGPNNPNFMKEKTAFLRKLRHDYPTLAKLFTIRNYNEWYMRKYINKPAKSEE